MDGAHLRVQGEINNRFSQLKKEVSHFSPSSLFNNKCFLNIVKKKALRFLA